MGRRDANQERVSICEFSDFMPACRHLATSPHHRPGNPVDRWQTGGPLDESLKNPLNIGISINPLDPVDQWTE
jgi:hypothetical protein